MFQGSCVHSKGTVLPGSYGASSLCPKGQTMGKKKRKEGRVGSLNGGFVCDLVPLGGELV